MCAYVGYNNRSACAGEKKSGAFLVLAGQVETKVPPVSHEYTTLVPKKIVFIDVMDSSFHLFFPTSNPDN